MEKGCSESIAYNSVDVRVYLLDVVRISWLLPPYFFFLSHFSIFPPANLSNSSDDIAQEQEHFAI